MADALPIAADVQTKKGYLMNGSLVVPIEVIIKAIEESSPGPFGDIPIDDVEIRSITHVQKIVRSEYMVTGVNIAFQRKDRT